MIVEMKRGKVNKLGRLGENEARTAQFPVGDVLGEHPGAEFVLMNRRAGDPDAYPVPSGQVTVIGENVCWTLTSGDLSQQGDGECELIATDGGVICKDEIYSTQVDRALDGSGEPPEPWESWQQQVADDAERAEAAAALLESPGAEAETLAPGSQATASYADGVFSFGIPQGPAGDPTELIDDTAGSGDTDKVWSADKLTDEVDSLKSAINELEGSLPTEDTGQELLENEFYNTGLTDTVLAVIGMIFNNLPQDEPAIDIVNSLSLECERLNAIYENWMSERSA